MQGARRRPWWLPRASRATPQTPLSLPTLRDRADFPSCGVVASLLGIYPTSSAPPCLRGNLPRSRPRGILRQAPTAPSCPELVPRRRPRSPLLFVATRKWCRRSHRATRIGAASQPRCTGAPRRAPIRAVRKVAHCEHPTARVPGDRSEPQFPRAVRQRKSCRANPCSPDPRSRYRAARRMRTPHPRRAENCGSAARGCTRLLVQKGGS